MFWNSNSSNSPFARFVRPSGKTLSESMVEFDHRWARFLDLLPTDTVLASMTDDEMCGRFGMDPSFFSTVVPTSIRLWRVSPSQSFINILGTFDGSSVPSGPMFKDIKQQTRILASGVLAEAIQMKDVRSVRGEGGKSLKVASDALAVTLVDDGPADLNDAARYFWAWESRNRARLAVGMIKAPKVLYRGIRDNTINIDVKNIEGEKWNVRHCRVHEQRRDILLSRPLTDVSESPILSFTSSLDVAKVFSFHEGNIVEIDPANYTIVASWCTDEELAGKDEILGRHEREWIIRPNPAFIPSPDQLTSWDRTMAFSTNDQTGVEMLHHRTEAQYEIDGHEVKAWFRYNSNGVGGRIVFQADGQGWGVGRQTIKREKGFDPVPSPDRPAKNLVFSSTSYVGGRTEYFTPYVRGEAVSAEAPKLGRSGR